METQRVDGGCTQEAHEACHVCDMLCIEPAAFPVEVYPRFTGIIEGEDE